MNDPEFKPYILAPLEIFGVDAFEPGQLVIKARIKTVPLKQWVVGRELRKRIARVFSERGIQHADAAHGRWTCGGLTGKCRRSEVRSAEVVTSTTLCDLCTC